MNLQAIKNRFGIIGRSELLDRALNTATRVAPTDLSVLITGESGVGKEVFSRIIHDLSKRKHNSFIALNTGAIPAGTINSELFGHEKGAFTGATSERKGYFETVDGGTIFLDEIGEMPLDTQAYLLRVLETGEFIKVGSSVVKKTDVRVIAATNVDLLDKIKKGKFREDLYYRLNTVPIKIPALHERREDIDMLFRKFAMDFADKYKTEAKRLDDQAKLVIKSYRWPGNVRELRNLVEQVSIMSEKNNVDVEELLAVAPHLMQRNLPAIKEQAGPNFEEREILYKFLFEMKNDLNDLKQLFVELVRTNNLDMPKLGMKQNQSFQNQEYYPSPSAENFATSRPFQAAPEVAINHNDGKPIVLPNFDEEAFDQTEEVEESLSLDEKTKELILKALKKHNGKRKDAADELGISERTLYRKIKEYDIKE